MILLIIAVITAIVIGALTHVAMLGIVLGVIVAGVYYVRDVKRHPRVPCRVCTGSGGENSRIGGGRWIRRPSGDCWCCGGKKAHPRPALRFLDPGQHRSIKAEVDRAKGKT